MKPQEQSEDFNAEFRRTAKAERVAPGEARNGVFAALKSFRAV